jgi:hypothetical protein
MANTFLALALVSIGFFVIFSIMIVHQLMKRGIRINFFLLKLYIIKYIHQYKQITIEETGKPGPLFYPCVLSVNLTLVFALIGLALK